MEYNPTQPDRKVRIGRTKALLAPPLRPRAAAALRERTVARWSAVDRGLDTHRRMGAMASTSANFPYRIDDSSSVSAGAHHFDFHSFNYKS